jgi:hypothetical protein
MEKLWKIHGKPWKIPSYQPKKEVYGQIHRKNHMANPAERSIFRIALAQVASAALLAPSPPR